jgi:hypothetical protein
MALPSSMSAFEGKADIPSTDLDVRLLPKADISAPVLLRCRNTHHKSMTVFAGIETVLLQRLESRVGS